MLSKFCLIIWNAIMHAWVGLVWTMNQGHEDGNISSKSWGRR
jgi:hypothetical protein